MISKSSVKRVDLSITVSGNTGSATFQHLGHIKTIAIKAPTTQSAYDGEITDNSGFGIWGRTGSIGNLTESCDVLVDDLCTLTLSNAANGKYSVRLYIDLSA